MTTHVHRLVLSVLVSLPSGLLAGIGSAASSYCRRRTACALRPLHYSGCSIVALPTFVLGPLAWSSFFPSCLRLTAAASCHLHCLRVPAAAPVRVRVRLCVLAFGASPPCTVPTLNSHLCACPLGLTKLKVDSVLQGFLINE